MPWEPVGGTDTPPCCHTRATTSPQCPLCTQLSPTQTAADGMQVHRHSLLQSLRPWPGHSPVLDATGHGDRPQCRPWCSSPLHAQGQRSGPSALQATSPPQLHPRARCKPLQSMAPALHRSCLGSSVPHQQGASLLLGSEVSKGCRRNGQRYWITL